MAFIRKIKKKDATYLVKVESYREDGKVKQRVLEYIGKEENGKAIQKVDINKVEVVNVKQFADATVLVQICKQLNLPFLLGKHYKAILALVIGHLLCKGSIRKIASWVEKSYIKEELGLEDLTTEMLYNAFDYLDNCNFNQIEQSLFAFWKSIAPKDNSTYVLDVTDTYHNGKHNDSMLRKGKDGKVSKLIQIGLAVSFDNGFPIMHKTYKGNISNIKILENMLAQIAERGLNTMILDRGFYSESNINDMNRLGMKMIVGVKQSIGIRKSILSNLNKELIYTKENLIKLKETTVYAIEIEFLFGKIIIIYNPKYEVMKKDHMLLEDAPLEDIKYVGYSLIFHNTSNDRKLIVKKYFDKDIVERSFKILKGDVQLHPIRLWLPNRIDAHVKMCYLALCILSLIKYRCLKFEMSASDILKEIQDVYKIKLRHTETKTCYFKVVTQSNNQKKIIKALKCNV